MKRTLKRLAVIFLVLLLMAGAYVSWRFSHPSMPADSQALPVGSGPAGAVTARYFGTTTLAFNNGRNTILVDALLTRPGMRQVLFGKLASDPATVNAILRKAGIARLDLLLVTHSHYDHVLDAASIAERTGARIAGSPSTREVALGGGVPDTRIIVVRPGETLTAGEFKVTAFKSLHSVPDQVPGEITAPLHVPAPSKEYREGGTYGYLIEHRGFRILVHASANFVPGMYRGVHADAVFLATGGLSSRPADFTRRYWVETVEATGAKLVIPIHWDDFFQPLDRPLQPLRRFLDNVPLTMDRIRPLATRDHVIVRYMPMISPVDIEAAAAQADAEGD